MVTRVLFPGRFQPFHLGHLHAIRELYRSFDEIVIVIGSAQEAYTCSNPFTAGERLEMIRYALESEGFDIRRFWLIPVPDLHKPLAWTTFVLGMVPKVDCVASGNPQVLGLYEWLGVKVLEIQHYKPHMYNGTIIRDLIARGLPWEDRVPKAVAEFIKRINGVRRIISLCRQKQ